MSHTSDIQILPYSYIVGQEQVKLALELAYITPSIEGVLLSGQRGTGKSTVVRAFAKMVSEGERLPVTLPINATEDRVVGGWKIDQLMQSKAVPQQGLLEEADGGLLYIDEVNLLDDHIVNIILDVTATGILVVQRDHQNREEVEVSFTFVGTMNPEEGGLRPQLLDRFGLMVSVRAELDETRRAKILRTVLDFEQAKHRLRSGKPADFMDKGRDLDRKLKSKLETARERMAKLNLSESIVKDCVKLANAFNVEGHRGDYVMALAAQAYAAIQGAKQVTKKHIETVAPLALQHRRPSAWQDNQELWLSEDDERMRKILYG